MRDKNDALKNYYESVTNSWTWERLTEEEQKRLTNLLFSDRVGNALKGPYLARWRVLNAVYEAFLVALDYKPIGWREQDVF